MDASREAYWARKLRPIRLGAEPVERQLALKLAGTVVISAVTLVIASIMLAIFGAFGRVDVGLRIFGLSCLPATSWFWLDFLILRSRASAYLREGGEATRNDPPPG